jgi:hypothetical protein
MEHSEIKEKVKNIEEEIKLQKQLIKQEKELLRTLERRSRIGAGTHTNHPKGAEHHLAKGWNVWELIDRKDKKYKYVGLFGSIGEIAKAYHKDYYTVWQMKRRWETRITPKGKPVYVQLRIEEVII